MYLGNDNTVAHRIKFGTRVDAGLLEKSTCDKIGILEVEITNSAVRNRSSRRKQGV